MQNIEKLSDQEKWNLLATVAHLYYNLDMTQNQIAERMYTSRSKISRMLKEARQLGIVEIHIREPWERSQQMEQQLCQQFSLNSVRIIRGKGLDGVVEAAAYYLDGSIRQDLKVGISWGNTLYHMIQYISKTNRKNIPITVASIMGVSNMVRPELDSLNLAKELASAYGGHYRYIPAPIFVKSRELKENLLQEEYVQSALSIAQSADMILTSVGSVAAKSWGHYISERTLKDLESKGAVGHIAGHFYDKNGQEVENALEERLIGVSIEDLRRCPEVICVAEGEEKAEALVGAIRAGIVNTVIIDDLCANKILQMG